MKRLTKNNHESDAICQWKHQLEGIQSVLVHLKVEVHD